MKNGALTALVAAVFLSGAGEIPASTALPAVPSIPDASTSMRSIAVGGQTIITKASAFTRVALGNPALADLKLLSNSSVRLVGLKPGRTDLTVWTKDAPEGQTYQLVIGPNVSVLNAALEKVSGAKAISDSSGIVLNGRVKSLEDHQRALASASLAGDAVKDQIEIADRRMVAVEVRFAAVSTQTMKALGLNFQKLGGGFQFASNVPNTTTAFQSSSAGLDVTSSLPLSQAFNLLLASPGNNFMGAISALNSANLAQILAEPTLLVRSGENASFLAGGEIPIPVPQAGLNTGITIQYRKFGVQLHVHATVLSDNRIVLRVNPEVSELDYQNALTLQGFNIPAITARSTDTTIELGDGQSFVLAGLMYSTSANMEEKVPGIGSLPIIGTLFKRSQLSNQQQELVIIATPRLVSPMASSEARNLPGTGVSYAPSLGETLTNTTNLDAFIAEHGLARP